MAVDDIIKLLQAQRNQFASTVNAGLGAGTQFVPDMEQRIKTPLDPSVLHAVISAKKGSGGGTGLAGESVDLSNPNTTTKDKIAEAAIQLERQKARVRAAGKEPTVNTTEGNKGILGRALSIVARPLDILARPTYATAEAANRVLTSEDSLPRSLDDYVKGFASGLMGRDKTMWGNVVQHASESDKSTAETFLRGGPIATLGSALPAKTKSGGLKFWESDKEHIAKTLLGLTGDIVSDPLTYVSLGSTAAVQAGTKAGEATLKEAGKEAAKNLAQKGFSSAVQKTVQWTPTKAGTAERVVETVRGGTARKVKALGKKEQDALVLQQQATARQHILDDILDFDKKVAKDRSILNKPYRPMGWDEADKARLAMAKGGGPFVTPADVMREFSRVAAEESNKLARITGDEYRNVIANLGRKRFRPGIGFLGKTKDVGEFSPGVARALEKSYQPFAKMGGLYRDSRVGSQMNKLFNYGEHFPGLTAKLRQEALAGGIRQFELYRREIVQRFNQLTRSEREQITDALEKGIQLSGVSKKSGLALDDFRVFAKEEFDKMWQEEAGMKLARRQSQHYVDNYVPHFYQRGSPAARRTFREARHKAITMGNGAAYSLDEATKAGLKPAKDVAFLLNKRMAEMQRKRAYEWFKAEVVSNFGIKAGKSFNDASFNKFKPLGADVPQSIRASLKQGEDWFVTEDIKKVMDTYKNLLQANNPEYISGFLNSVGNINRHFKFWATVPNPRYHVRNMLGDSFLSWLDGTKASDYARITAAKLSGKPLTLGYGANRIKMSIDQLWEMFISKEGASTYFDTEFLQGKPLSAALDYARRGSNYRENFGRFVHFVSALDDEYKKIVKDKITAGGAFKFGWRQKALDKAETVARGRVNKFNIDYSALTPLEQKYIRRFVPFYTFVRKVTPLMFEQMVTNPGRMSMIPKVSKAVQDLLGVDQDEYYDGLTIPQYARDLGYTRLNDEHEPLIYQHQALPTSNIGEIFGGGSLEEIARSAAAKLTPPLRIPIEIATGKSLFQNRDINGQYVDYLLNQIPPVASEKALSRGGGSAESILRFFGIDVRKVSEAQQVSEIKRQQDPVQFQISQLNNRLEANDLAIVTLNRKGGTIWALKNTKTKKIIGEFKSAAEAQARAQELLQ